MAPVANYSPFSIIKDDECFIPPALGGPEFQQCRTVVPKLGSPNVLGQQLPEILASTASSEGFWEF